MIDDFIVSSGLLSNFIDYIRCRVSTHAPDGSINLPFCFFPVIPGNSQIFFLNCTIFKLSGQVRMGLIVLRNQNHTGSIFIQSMDDPRSKNSIEIRQGFKMECQSIHQSMISFSNTWMHNHSSGLINSNHIFILVENMQRYIFWCNPV